jgi:DnaA family protein
MSDAPEQLALGLRLRADATFANFVAVPTANISSDNVFSGNAATAYALREWLEQPTDGFFYLCGAPGSGRSHLLQAACHFLDGASVIYLPLAEFKSADPIALLDNLEQAQLLCLDDIDAVTADAQWCEQLFHLCNRALAASRKIVVSAVQPPALLDCALEDLRSRLAWGGSFRLHELDDDGRRLLLQTRARERGFELADDVVAYILSRYSRDLAALLALLDELDRQSLAQQKRITIPFVRSFIQLPLS